MLWISLPPLTDPAALRPFNGTSVWQRYEGYCLLPIVLLLLVSPVAVSQTLFGAVTRVVDGDTVIFKVHKGKTERNPAG